MSRTYVAPKDTVSVALDDRWTAVVNPSMTIPVAVVENDALRVVDYCRTGGEIEDIAELFPKKSRQEISRVCVDLEKAGLLFPTAVPEPEFGLSEELGCWVHVTNDCNLRCTYCYVAKSRDHLNEETGRKIIDSVFRSAGIHGKKQVKFKFSGGEALLEFPLLKRLTAYADEKSQQTGIPVTNVVLSNGTIMTEEMLSWMESEKVHLMLSIDGLKVYHDAQRMFPNGAGSFDLVERTIDRVLLRDIAMNISVTITNRSAQGLPSLMRWILEKKINFAINFYRENTCSEDETSLAIEESLFASVKEAYEVIAKYLPETCLLNVLADRAVFGSLHDKPCSVGESYLVFNHNGKISKCQMTMDDIVSDCSALDPLGDVMHTPRGIKNIPVDQKKTCRDCVWRHFCAGGCPLMAYRTWGEYDRSSPNCALYKKMFPEIVRLEGLRLVKYQEMK